MCHLLTDHEILVPAQVKPVRRAIVSQARGNQKTGGAAGRTMRERAVIIASGLMAGGALGGVLGASFRLFSWYGEDNIRTPFYGIEAVSQTVSIVFFVGLCLYLWIDSTRKVREN